MPPVHRTIRLLALTLGILIAASALICAGLALAPLLSSGQRPAWLLFGFELVVLVAAVIAVLFGRGRFAEAPGMALACVAGTVFLGSAMGWQAAGRQLGGVSLTPFLAGRVAVSLVLGAAAAACVLSRDRQAWRLAALGTLLALPVLGALAAVALPAGRRALENAIGPSVGLQAAVGVGAFLVLGGLLSASVHILVRAFEMGRTDATSSRSA